jgi:hypothetical protein
MSEPESGKRIPEDAARLAVRGDGEHHASLGPPARTGRLTTDADAPESEAAAEARIPSGSAALAVAHSLRFRRPGS